MTARRQAAEGPATDGAAAPTNSDNGNLQNYLFSEEQQTNIQNHEAANPRALRLTVAAATQEGRCLWCGTAFGALTPATTDHVVPRAKGGPSWAENEAAACRRCNAARGHTAPTAWFEECRRRGWPADGARLAGYLDALDAAIAERGGQRRARPYLEAQRRRLARVLRTA